MPKVTLRFAPYMRGDPEWREISAYVAGDLAIYRPAWISAEGDLSVSKRSWTVSHIPTGDRVESALPDRLKDRGAIIATRDQLAQWAADWQAACPDFFAAAKVAPINPDVLAAHGRDALDKGRAL